MFLLRALWRTVKEEEWRREEKSSQGLREAVMSEKA